MHTGRWRGGREMKQHPIKGKFSKKKNGNKNEIKPKIPLAIFF
jgi:hypothetical protein